MDSMAAMKERMNRLRELIENYDCENDETLSAMWSERQYGKRIVTDDIAKAEESRITASITGMAAIKLPPRLFACKLPGPFILEFMAQPSSHLVNLHTEIRLQNLEEALKLMASSGLSVIFACKRLFVEGRTIAMRNNVVYESELPSYAFLQNRRQHIVLTLVRKG